MKAEIKKAWQRKKVVLNSQQFLSNTKMDHIKFSKFKRRCVSRVLTGFLRAQAPFIAIEHHLVKEVPHSIENHHRNI
jgi:hypothetical protein